MSKMWKTDELLSSENFNAIEEGVAEINNEYVPYEWKAGDVITANRLNAIEQGIANASGGGGSDFSMAEVTLVNSADSNRAVLIPVCYEPSPFDPDASVGSTVQMVVNDTLKLNVPLYKGHCSIRKGISEDRLQGVTVATSFTVTSGSATSSMEGVDITGDCTITVS